MAENGYTVYSLRCLFIEAELEDAKGRLLMHEQEYKLAEEQLRDREEEGWSSEKEQGSGSTVSAKGGVHDQVVDTNAHHN